MLCSRLLSYLLKSWWFRGKMVELTIFLLRRCHLHVPLGATSPDPASTCPSLSSASRAALAAASRFIAICFRSKSIFLSFYNKTNGSEPSCQISHWAQAFYNLITSAISFCNSSFSFSSFLSFASCSCFFFSSSSSRSLGSWPGCWMMKTTWKLTKKWETQLSIDCSPLARRPGPLRDNSRRHWPEPRMQRLHFVGPQWP